MVEKRPYPPPPAPAPSSARPLGDRIHSLTPTTSIQERCKKFIDSLDPVRPDPPALDEPYEYPSTQPLDPRSIPKITNGRNFPVPNDRAAWMPENVRAPSDADHAYYAAPPIVKRDRRGGERERRPKPRGGRHEYDDESSGRDECARRLYRLHT